MSQQYQIPATPRVISPSPTPSETADSSGSYFAPVTRSAAKRVASSVSIPEEKDSDSEVERRARARSRKTEAAAASQVNNKSLSGLRLNETEGGIKAENTISNGIQNGHLSPASAASSYWRDISRSPSPLGLIPIHQSWRSFIHRHEIPRKALHVSIGFVTLRLYTLGYQADSIHPWLLAAVIPIASVDVLRHKSASFNRFYVRVLGALMRESEVNDKYNGVIFYLLGAWAALRFFPKDVGVMSVLLLSWCDTAASTFGRLYGRYTPRIRKGKSVAGSIAAAVVGAATATLFWGYLVPKFWGYEESFLFKGNLKFPHLISPILAVKTTPAIFTDWTAISVIGLWSGVVASFSEAVDIFGLDDNLTIPVLSGLGLWGFLKVFA